MVSKRSDLDPLPAHLLVPEPGEDDADLPIARVWERLPRETDLEWSYFRLYLDQAYQIAGKYQARNLRALSETIGINAVNLGKIADAFRWVQRAGAWDREVDRREKTARLDEAERVGRSHMRFASKLRGLAESELEKMVAKAAVDHEMTMKPRDIFDAFSLAMKIEQTATIPKAKEIGESQANLEALELDDLVKLKEVLDKAKK